MPTVPTDTRTVQPTIDILSENLFGVVSVILVFVAILLIVGLVIQTASYYGGLRTAVAVGAIPAGAAKPSIDLVDHAAVITYARGLGAAFVKTSAMFLGFILIFTGTLYVLRTGEAAFALQGESNGARLSLQTTSPGLVVVTLGVILTVVAITTKSEIDYEKTTQPVDQSSAESVSPADTIKPGASSHAPENPGKPGESGQEERR